MGTVLDNNNGWYTISLITIASFSIIIYDLVISWMICWCLESSPSIGTFNKTLRKSGTTMHLASETNVKVCDLNL